MAHVTSVVVMGVAVVTTSEQSARSIVREHLYDESIGCDHRFEESRSSTGPGSDLILVILK